YRLVSLPLKVDLHTPESRVKPIDCSRQLGGLSEALAKGRIGGDLVVAQCTRLVAGEVHRGPTTKLKERAILLREDILVAPRATRADEGRRCVAERLNVGKRFA